VSGVGAFQLEGRSSPTIRGDRRAIESDRTLWHNRWRRVAETCGARLEITLRGLQLALFSGRDLENTAIGGG